MLTSTTSPNSPHILSLGIPNLTISREEDAAEGDDSAEEDTPAEEDDAGAEDLEFLRLGVPRLGI